MKINIDIVLLAAGLFAARGAENAGNAETQAPARMFRPFEFLQGNTSCTRTCCAGDDKAKPDPEIAMDYMPIDGKLLGRPAGWRIVLHGHQSRRSRSPDYSRAESIGPRHPRYLPAANSAEDRLNSSPQMVAGHYVNVLAKRHNGYWNVIGNRPIPGSIMGTMTTVTNAQQLLEVGMDAVSK